MKLLVFFYSCLFLGCFGQNENQFSFGLCENEIHLTSKEDSVSIFTKLNFSDTYQTLIKEYQFEKEPIYLDLGSDIFIKVDFEITDNSRGMRLVNNEEILINGNDQLLYGGNFIMLKDLSKTISNTAQLDGNLKFIIKWAENTDKEVIKLTFKKVVLGYLSLLEKTLEIDICNLSKNELNSIKDEYQLVFLFRNFKTKLPAPPLPISIEKE